MKITTVLVVLALSAPGLAFAQGNSPGPTGNGTTAGGDSGNSSTKGSGNTQGAGTGGTNNGAASTTSSGRPAGADSDVSGKPAR